MSNAYEAIAQLRPEFLRSRADEARDRNDPTGSQLTSGNEDVSARYPTVYVNGLRLGGPAILRSISAGIIIRIRYYKEPGIPIAYGRNNPGGIIEVTTIG